MVEKTINVNIISAEEKIYSGPCKMVFATGQLGEMGIAPEHAPLLSTLRPGEIRVINQAGEEVFFYVSGGMLEIQPFEVTVLADTAVRAHDIDEAAAIEAKQRAEQAMQNRESDFDYSLVEGELAQAIAQLRALKRLRKKSGS